MLLTLAFVQLGSDALFGSFLPHSLGVQIYRALDHVAPASYVEDSLANDALARGNLDEAQHYAVRMPESRRRDETLARIALARGQNVLAGEYFFAADDIEAMQARVRELAAHDVPAALAYEARIRARLISETTHPDAVAESWWIGGNLEAQRGLRAAALAQYERAEALAPLDVKYILAVANTALQINDLATAQRLYQHGASIAPGSGDMPAGLGLVALHRGDRATAVVFERRAERIDPHAPMLAALKTALQ